MPSFLEKILNVVLLGLLPPVPIELRSDYVQATAEEQAQYRIKYAGKHLRWTRIVSGLAMLMLVKWAWEFGFLAIFGLGSGIATGNDVDNLRHGQQEARRELQAARSETLGFIARYDRDIIEAKLRANAAETYQVETAISDAYRAGRAPDSLHQRRLSDLKSEKAELERQLARLDQIR